MILRTEYKAKSSNIKINHKDNILFLGSCFAENIQEYFKTYKFSTFTNPYGIVYNPVSIYNALDITVNKVDIQSSVFSHNNLQASFFMHSCMSRTGEEEFMNNFIHKRDLFLEALIKANYIFITLGSANVYRNISTQTIVANCHKLPQNCFSKETLHLDTINESLAGIKNIISSVNKKAKLIFTLSPVRYLKDGFEENNLSKSLLYIGIKNSVENNENVEYFPSYEYVTDDLRDYRFYKKDMVHPNELALDYVWEKLKTTYFTPQTQQILAKIDMVNKRRHHHFFNPSSEESLSFIKKTKKLQEELNLMLKA